MALFSIGLLNLLPNFTQKQSRLRQLLDLNVILRIGKGRRLLMTGVIAMWLQFLRTLSVLSHTHTEHRMTLDVTTKEM